MGNLQGVTHDYPWDSKNEPANGAGNYDAAGYIPVGMTYPPQESWNEARNYGGRNHMRTTLKDPDINGVTIDWGATEGLLTSFGTIGAAGYPKLYDIDAGLPDTNSRVDGEYGSVKNQPVPYVQWKPGTTNTCTPETFPNCDMTAMMEAGGEANFFDGITQTAGRIYSESIDRAYNNAFLTGGIETLQQVNTSEHSTFDPCSGPTLLEVLLPLLAGAAAVSVYSYYGKPEITLAVGQEAATLGDVMVFGFVYNYSKGLLEYFNEPTNIHFERAARCLVYPLTAWGGNQAGLWALGQTSQESNQQYFQLAGVGVGVFLGERKLVIPISKVLAKGGILAGLLLGTFTFLIRGISGFWCNLTTNQDSCAAVDLEEFQDSRRWDAVSIAAMLTLEVCEREGWQKDSKEAQFVFYGLLTGPGMMTAPMDDEGSLSMFDQTLVNPLGFLYAGRWQQALGATYKNGKDDVWFQRSADIFGWDGDHSGWLDLANLNLYSCENWDVMREGLQQKTHPGAKRLKRKFDKWIGNWQDPGSPAGLLVAAAKIPANIEAMKHIPGWEREDATNMSTGVTTAQLDKLAQLLPEKPVKYIPPPPGEYIHLDVLPLDLNRPIEPIGMPTNLQFDYGADPLRSAQGLEQLWYNNVLMGANDFATYSLVDMSQYAKVVLNTPHVCQQSSVQYRGSFWVLRWLCAEYISNPTELYNSMQQMFIWGDQGLIDAAHVVTYLTASKNPNVAAKAKAFEGGAGGQFRGFSTIPKVITDTWCTNE